MTQFEICPKPVEGSFLQRGIHGLSVCPLQIERWVTKNRDYTQISEPMKSCEQKDELQRRLRAAFDDWYAVRDVAGKDRQAKAAQKKVHHIQRALGDHVSKHGCNRD